MREPVPPSRLSELTPSAFGGVMAKTLKPSRSSRDRTSLAAAASTVRVTISPAGVPKRQMNSAIFRFGVYHAVIRQRDDDRPREWSQFASRRSSKLVAESLQEKD